MQRDPRAFLWDVREAGLAAAVVTPQAQAAAVSGKGTWETTLQGRDLDGNATTFEAYYDSVLNITWLADANYAETSSDDEDFSGRMSWDAAKTWAAQLNINGVTGWRLPDVKPVNGSSFNYNFSSAGTTDYGFNITSPQSELAHLYHVTLGNKSYFDTASNAPQSGGLQNPGPFSNVQSSVYWSGVEYAPNPIFAWYLVTYNGAQSAYYKYDELSAWAVRPGDVAAVPEPQTYALMLVGLSALLLVVRRRRHH